VTRARIAAAALFLSAGMLLTGGMDARALELGETTSGYAELNGRQVPLPAGDWVVAGKGRNGVVEGVAGAFGTIDNDILFRIDGDRVTAMAEINTNYISVTEGWGTTQACASEDSLATFNLYRTAVDGLCFFVEATDIPLDTRDAPDAWAEAVAYAEDNGLTVPEDWLTVGYRVSDRYDIVDARLHFDGAELRGLAPGNTDWSKDAVEGHPGKTVVVNDLRSWAGLMAGLYERGLRGRLADHLGSAQVPDPLVEIEDGSLENDRVGRAGKAERMAALEALVETGVIPPESLAAYAAAVENITPPPTLEDYYQTLVMKTISYNFFRVSVDYLLAFIVTVDAAVSGYITAAIVATHSVAQILNDMAWDNYISGQRRDGSELVEFHYLGRQEVSL